MPELPEPPPKGLALLPDVAAGAVVSNVELELEPELVAVVIVVDGRAEPEEILVSEAPEEDEPAAEDADEELAEDEDELGAAVPSMVPKPVLSQ